MKIKILSFIAAFLLLGSVNKTFANNNATVLKETAAVNKIEVRGNVELYISDATTDQIKVYNKYYAESALVQNKNGVLRITSYGTEKLVVWVSATDLRSVSMYDNSVVKSFGKINKIEFNVELHNGAEAYLNLDAFAVNLSVKDNAKANISGSAQDVVLSRDIRASLNSRAFAVTHLYENKRSFAAVADVLTTDM